MSHLHKFYLINSRKDLVSKLNSYKNVNEINCIQHIDLNFSELKNKSSVILCLSFFYLLTSKYGKQSTSLSSGNKKAKKNFGCSLRLSDKEVFHFIEKILFLNFDNVSELNEFFSKSNLSNNKTFSFSVKDIYNFSELGEDLFKYRFLKNLRIYFSFKDKEKKANFFLLQSLGFKF